MTEFMLKCGKAIGTVIVGIFTIGMGLWEIITERKKLKG